jgi:hypothetical protein
MGMADIVPKLRALTTNIALGHFIHPFHKSAAPTAADLRF